ncbi:A/G-specific adenine glycosylase [Acidovorax carolinensis]|uniref:A/G-specific adenine glycosylase n=1 Tax=Acidovorax carolinensis TaxID=553814 RepID=UPI000B3411F5|nr:A/G-specific adenine glycosylase [Acidovorax carolinensis]ART49224.1 A/G-specific adenine glycosylase [Acidovorax carolinensis]
MILSETDVATRVVRWQASHGRNHLPWQQTRDPYRVWLSEIMLQQTQVSTVLGYYVRFLERFPDVRALAAAPQDDVMALWSGLGYYSRARNLHRCAQTVVNEHGGKFPRSAQVLATLPGIGRSTAGAIAAFCFSERTPILDANVRRVLTRVLGFDADLALSRNERTLWLHAQSLLPSVDIDTAMPRYTQGLMDLGASLCTPRNPACPQCPLHTLCVAHREGAPERYPVRTRTLKRRSESWWLLVLQDPVGRVWLSRRPAVGIWAGLYCVPVFPLRSDVSVFLDDAGPISGQTMEEKAPFLHVLTHRDLHLHPFIVRQYGRAAPDDDGAWFTAAQFGALGLPAPIRKLLAGL